MVSFIELFPTTDTPFDNNKYKWHNHMLIFLTLLSVSTFAKKKKKRQKSKKKQNKTTNG